MIKILHQSVKERPYWSRCSSREMEFLQKLDGSICAWMPESTTVRLRLSPVGLMTSSRNLRSIPVFAGACRQLWTKWQREKHRHETN
ncbi:hypothetical protein T01_12688 [Trichinella spiralis]|uniref:Uncharacterized protein n=1 Tax=Trichinella spiralis TaxID=6334 RepID=A0A0V0Z7E3_TRISP|nr:hypothetical protein T01_12688 [Trichinella spiralis]